MRMKQLKRLARRIRRGNPAAGREYTHGLSDIQQYQFLSKYARWDEAKGRRETWRECVERVLTFFRSRKQLESISEELWAELEQALHGQEVACASRILQMAGPALEYCNVAAYNCAFLEIDCLEAFAELLYVLMRGAGCGFSVEAACIRHLPSVEHQATPPRVETFIVADTTEGWCDALLFGLRRWFAGGDVRYDFSRIRPAGARLRTTGGRASGPEPLRQLLDFVRLRVLARQGDRLTDLDVHDLCCGIGRYIQVGGTRRASEISLSDLASDAMRFAKSGPWWEAAPWRATANNSAVYEVKPDPASFEEEWQALAQSGSGERGIFNRWAVLRTLPRRRKPARFGLNPCGEIILRSCQMCNLSSVIARPNDTVADLRRKVRLAAIWGTFQSALTDFRYLRPIWKQNGEEERLLGVDITGQMDCPLLRPGAPGLAELLRELKQVVLWTNADYAGRLGLPRSAATSCVKPSGNSALFFGCSSGIHPRYARFQVRRFRADNGDPLTRMLQDAGVPWDFDPLNEGLVVFDFYPEPAPAGCPTRDDLTALEQLENWLVWKREWAEHSISCTVYVAAREWGQVGRWVYRHFEEISSIAFLPKDGGNYRLMPNEELDEPDYRARRAAFPRIDWTALSRYERKDMTRSAREYACVADRCAF
jgi:ribonucleoside-triphosphate reductase